jgi:hypothetical protein
MNVNEKVHINDIWVIGTFHGSMKQMKNYDFQILEDIIKKINPDLILAEIRPEDLEKNDFSKAPLDIEEIVLPYTKHKGIPLHGIDWYPDDMRAKKAEFFEKLAQSENGKKIINELPDELEIHNIDLAHLDLITTEFVHSDQFAQIDKAFRKTIVEKIGEGPQNLWWFTRAQKMNALIKKYLKLYSGKRIVVVAGAFHRPDIEDFLLSLDRVKLQKMK